MIFTDAKYALIFVVNQREIHRLQVIGILPSLGDNHD